MQRRSSVAPGATAAPPAGLPASPASSAAAFAAVPDPRRRAGVTSALPAILTAAVAALLCDHRAVLAITQWMARQAPEALPRLGSPAGRTPRRSTVQRLFAKLDGHARPARPPAPRPRRLPRVIRRGIVHSSRRP